MSLKPRPKLPNAPSIKAELPLHRRRAILRARKARLVSDLSTFGALFPTPEIEAQRAQWRAELESVMADLAWVEQNTTKAPPMG